MSTKAYALGAQAGRQGLGTQANHYKAARSRAEWLRGYESAEDGDAYEAMCRKAESIAQRGYALRDPQRKHRTPVDVLAELRRLYPRHARGLEPADLLRCQPPPFDLLKVAAGSFRWACADCGLDTRYVSHEACCDSTERPIDVDPNRLFWVRGEYSERLVALADWARVALLCSGTIDARGWTRRRRRESIDWLWWGQEGSGHRGEVAARLSSSSPEW